MPLAALCAAALWTLAGPEAAGASQETPAAGGGQGRGAELYAEWCAGCHGVEGYGDGPAADRMLPRPRDFTEALYQVRTTPSGALPTDEDILRVINEGMPGTTMPGWEKKFSGSERRELVRYLKTLSPFFETEEPPEPYRIGKPPRVTPEGLAEGRALYEEIECWKCHGEAGRGDGPSAPTLRDDADLPIRATDLTENWTFNGGGSVREIFTRLRTGLDGTPMPTFTDLIDSDVVTEEQLWRLAQYVRSLAPENPPVVREVVRADRIEGTLPGSPADPRWDDVERFYVPLVGQVIVPFRWFAPAVDGVWVQALHNGEELALRLVWDDPSRSPDPDWLEWQAAVREAMASDRETPAEVRPLPDAFAVQFPVGAAEGLQRPYFLMGSPTNPVALWRWQSEPDEAVQAIARGLGRIEPRPQESPALRHAAVFDRGEWRLQFTRSLTTADSAHTIQLEPGRVIPIAFFAWDGSNGEQGTEGAISSWYYIALTRPTPPGVYFSPVLTAALTVGLGLLAVWRAQRRAGSEPGRG